MPTKSTVKSIISWYSDHVPIARGRGRLQALGLRVMGVQDVIAHSKDGLPFRLHFPEDQYLSSIYYSGTWEAGTLEIMKRLIRPDDIVFDIGANVGWFTVHMASLLSDGQCHSFEPMPATFNKLVANCRLNELTNRVTLNQIALGDRDRTCELFAFDGLAHACSSLSTLGRKDNHAIEVGMQTLNRYIDDKRLQRVDLIKMDAEGAEMLVLNGAERLFGFRQRPIWIIELNVETAHRFGYKPHDLLKRLRERSECDFYLICGAWGKMRPLRSLEEYDNGDNCICIPKERAQQWRDANRADGCYVSY